MAFSRVALCLLLGLAGVSASQSSPVQKVIELLDELKGKVVSDLAAEKEAFGEYATYCDDEASAKNYAIKTAKREIGELTAAMEDSNAEILQATSQITELGNVIAAKTGEKDKATADRKAANAVFVAGEAELVESVDSIGRGITALKQGQTALLQGSSKQHWKKVLDAVSTVVDAMRVSTSSKEKLQSLLQASKKNVEHADGDDDLEMPTVESLSPPASFLQQPNPAAPAFESQGGAIIETMEEMEDKTTKSLRDLRKEEMQSNMDYQLLKSGLEQEISHAEEKLATAKQTKSAAEQALEDATGKKLDTEKSKAADEEYLANLKSECQAKARDWEERERSGNGEIAAVAKASEILSSGVTALTQVGRRVAVARGGDAATRSRVVELIQGLSKQTSSFALAQLATAVASDPFVKIRGLIDTMIEKLEKEAEKEATKEAFCQEELGKSNAAKAKKTGEQSKNKARMDLAESSIAKLLQAVKKLQSEIAEIDQAQAEATELRSKENAEFKKASSDYKGSAEAVAQAIEVLRQYYEGGSFVQVRSSTHRLQAREPQSDSAHTIISVLDMCQQDFTDLLAESEATEAEAKSAYEKLTQENKISKMTKEVEFKGKESEIKSIKVNLEHSTEDFDSVSKELDAVNAYLAKLEPECESTGMSYAERKAAREAEVEGLKEALTILEGPAAFVQTGRQLRLQRA